MGADTRRGSCYDGAHGMLQRRNPQWREVKRTTRLRVGGIDDINMQGSGQSWNLGRGLGPRPTLRKSPAGCPGQPQRPAADRSRRRLSRHEGLQSRTSLLLRNIIRPLNISRCARPHYWPVPYVLEGTTPQANEHACDHRPRHLFLRGSAYDTSASCDFLLDIVALLGLAEEFGSTRRVRKYAFDSTSSSQARAGPRQFLCRPLRLYRKLKTRIRQPGGGSCEAATSREDCGTVLAG